MKGKQKPKLTVLEDDELEDFSNHEQEHVLSAPFHEKVSKRLQQEDKIDRENYRKRIKEMHKEQKRKKKQKTLDHNEEGVQVFLGSAEEADIQSEIEEEDNLEDKALRLINREN